MSWAATQQDYDLLILGARNGNYQPALQMLQQRLQDTPKDQRALYDYIVISDWAGRSQQAIEAYENAGSPDNIPAQPLAAVARSYRNQQQWNKSIALYLRGEQRYPSKKEFSLGTVMTLADAKHSAQAIDRGRELRLRLPRDPDSHLALAYAYDLDNQPFASLSEATTAYSLAPDKPYVVRAYVLALQSAQLPQAALLLATQRPGVLKPAQIRSLQGDFAAQLTRTAATPTRTEADRFLLADRAIELYDRLIKEWKALGPVAHDDVIRAEVDRLQALHVRKRMSDVVRNYESILSREITVPDYVLGDVADAYLYLRQPKKAAPLFQKLLDSAPGKQNSYTRTISQVGLFYALTESSSLGAEDNLLEIAASEQPTWLYVKGDPKRKSNTLKLNADLTQAMSYLYEGDAPKAQRRLDHMVATAPNNTRLRTARSEIYRRRSLPRHSEQDLKIAEAESPRSVELEINQAATALALQEWRDAKLLHDDVMARMPEDQSARSLDRDWIVHNMAELRITASRGLSTGSPVTGSHEWDIDSVLYTPPISENWRGFAGTGYSSADFEEGTGRYRWMRAGAEWRSRDITAQAEVSGNDFGSGTRTGAALFAAFDINDHWQIGASGAVLSRDTPLRALQHDIRSNKLNAYVRWRADNRREWRFSLAGAHFTDGNNRVETTLSGRERLYTTPALEIDALLDLSTSHNSLRDTPYFNPRSDLTILPALQLTHVLHRSYDTVWSQQLLLGAGAYAQQGYGSSGVFTAGYGQRFRYNKVFDVGIMVSGTSRAYDGQRERDYKILVDLTYRF